MNKPFILLLLISFNSFATGYYGRFWRGESKKSYPELKSYCDDQKLDCFKELVNRWLIPATPSYAAKGSLMAYAPVLLPYSLLDKYHDEVALILYKSEATYRALRNGDVEGQQYGPIHGDIFETGIRGTKESSRSLVPGYYNGKIELIGKLKEVSYEVINKQNDLINTNGLFQLIERSYMSVTEFLNKADKYIKNLKNSNLAGVYMLINEDYIMTYTFFYNDVYAVNTSGLNVTWQTELKKISPTQRAPLIYDYIDYGEGANLLFTPGVKPGQVDHCRLHL